MVEEGFWAIRRLFSRLARDRPLVVVLDDAHWAEAMLLALVENVARHTESVPILIVCISRPDLLERRTDWGKSAERSTIVRLDPLDDAACDRLISELLGESEPTLEVRDHVAARAEGNPLFVEQMISMLIDDGTLEQVDGRWVTVGDVETMNVPPGIHALLAARLERLSADEYAVLGRAAVMGQVFYVGALEELVPPSVQGRVQSILYELVRKELVRPGRSDLGTEAVEFRHLLIRDAAYESLSKQSRADLHARFADWLERTAADRSQEYAEIVGWHLEQAHRNLSELGPLDQRGIDIARRAADHLAAAGWVASARGDVSAGVTLRSRSLALMGSDDERRPTQLADLGDALLWSGRFEEAERALAEAIELSTGAGDERTRVRARLSQMRLQFQVDPDTDYTELEEEGLAAAEHCEESGDDFGAARAWRVVYWARWGLCKLDGLRPAAERAYEYDRRAQDQHYPQDDLIGVLASLVFGLTPASEALRQGLEILERVRGHRGAEAYALCFLGQTRGMMGEREAGREMILKGVADRRELGDFPGAAMASAEGLGYFVEMTRGDWDAAEYELRRGYDELVAMGDKNYLATAAGWLAHCLYRLGRYDEADGFASICERSAARSALSPQMLWRSARAMILAQRGDVETAETLAREAVSIALRTERADTQTDALMSLGEVLRLSGRTAEAVPVFADALRRYEAKEVLPAALRVRALLAELAPTVGEQALA